MKTIKYCSGDINVEVACLILSYNNQNSCNPLVLRLIDGSLGKKLVLSDRLELAARVDTVYKHGDLHEIDLSSTNGKLVINYE